MSVGVSLTRNNFWKNIFFPNNFCVLKDIINLNILTKNEKNP